MAGERPVPVKVSAPPLPQLPDRVLKMFTLVLPPTRDCNKQGHRMSTEMTKKTTGADAGVPLAEMIQTLRHDLEAAQAGGSSSNLRFRIEKVDLELKVAISRTAKASGGVEFWVIKAGGEMEKGSETIHTFTLSLTPISADSGGRVEVSARSGERLQED